MTARSNSCLQKALAGIPASLALLAVLLCGSSLFAQNAAISLSNSAGVDGATVSSTVSVSCDLPVDAFSFGLAHDPTELELLGLAVGPALQPGAGGIDPEFLSLNPTPVGGPGAVVGCVLDFALSSRLASIISHDVIEVQYQVVAGNPPGDSVVSFTSLLGAPAIEVLVLSDVIEMVPGATAGVVTRLGPDCNNNGMADLDELANGTAFDCDGNGMLDECDLTLGLLSDCDGDSIPDSCAILDGTVQDCNLNSTPDSCDIDSGVEPDCDLDGIPDGCAILSGAVGDCDGDQIPDSCEIAQGVESDCDLDGVPDSCAILSGAAADCDGDQIPDSCEIAQGAEADCDGDGVIDGCAIAAGTVIDTDMNGIPDSCEDRMIRSDVNADGTTNIVDPIFLLDYLFVGGPSPTCFQAADFFADGAVDITDAIQLLGYLFIGGAPPVGPFPNCGASDPSSTVSCDSHAACP